MIIYAILTIMSVSKNNQIRIIGGTLRGRKIDFYQASEDTALRPTPDRVRETLFNWLSPVIFNAECLDAFGGSGALSFEAVSRGTTHVTLIEQCPKITKIIQENAERFNINKQQLSILCKNTLDYLAQTTQTFDLIFLDPPFQKNLLMPCIKLIAERNLLRENSFLYTESHEPIQLDAKNWENFRAKKAGNVYYGLWCPINNLAPIFSHEA